MFGTYPALALTCGGGCTLVTNDTAYCRCPATTTTTTTTNTTTTTTRPTTSTTTPVTTTSTTTRTTSSTTTTRPNGICPTGKCAGFSDSDCDETLCGGGQVCSNGTCVNGNCTNGETQACVTSNGACTGVRTCSASSWGECVSTQTGCPSVSGCTGCATAGCGECSSTSAGFACYCSGSLGNGVYTSCQGASGHPECTGGGDCGVTGGNNCGGLNQPRCDCGCGPGLTSCTNAYGIFCAYDCTPSTTAPIACQNGETRGCTVNSCPGTQVCSNGSWGGCADNAGDGCPAPVNCTYTVCECSGGNCQTVSKSGTTPCPSSQSCKSCPAYNTCSLSGACNVPNPSSTIMGGACPTGCTSPCIGDTKPCNWKSCSGSSCSINESSIIPIGQTCPTGCSTNNDCSIVTSGTVTISGLCGIDSVKVTATVQGGTTPYQKYVWYKQVGNTISIDYEQPCSHGVCSNTHTYALSGKSSITYYLRVEDSANNAWASSLETTNCFPMESGNRCGVNPDGSRFCGVGILNLPGTGKTCNVAQNPSDECGSCN